MVNVLESIVSNNKQMHNKIYYLEFDHQYVHVSNFFCFILSLYIYTEEKQERKERRNTIPATQNVLWTRTLLSMKMSVLELKDLPYSNFLEMHQ